ncbi:lipoprotein signal peptidase [Bacteroidia bacterium]|nr:lipoprotein signal peptidase [Bacteroidia bacterium]GHT06139.1 lipoprotein signal peptidase [Bacteroidia bacterium]GHT47515.1 lipoprotein signal peptidase [Bacteroidia bacterium]
MKSKGFWAILTILLILSADQILKIWIKTHLYIGEDIRIANWFYIRFVENNGMAMGIEVIGKLFLSIFRIVASFGIIYYLYLLVKKNFKLGYILCVSMIFAGAVGNIIDSIFYGVIFSESTAYSVATLFPPEGGYGTWLHGRVVDMFYFPLFKFHWPSWIPWIGGNEFVFFRYIFNLADASISVGIAVLLLFYRNTFSGSFEK